MLCYATCCGTRRRLFLKMVRKRRETTIDLDVVYRGVRIDESKVIASMWDAWSLCCYDTYPFVGFENGS